VHSKHKFRIINPFFFNSTGQQQQDIINHLPDES
jgi:hypothetical protein